MKLSNYTQEVQLPSKGYLNPEIPEGKLVQRCMMVSDQKFLSGSSINSGSLMKELLERTIESPEHLDVGKLTIYDTLYLLFKLRILSYGDMYKFTTKCPECGKKIEINLNISEIPVSSLIENYENKLKVVLPRAEDTVYTKFLRNDDISAISEEVERRRKRNPEDDSEYVLRLASMVKKIELKEKNCDGDRILENPLDIQDYVEGLTDLDAIAIKSTIDSVQYGIDSIVDYKCPLCRSHIDVSLRINPNFFRPKYDF